MRYLLPAILLLGTQIASAQSILKDKDDKESSVLLNEVVITGTGTEHYLKDAPVQTEVITSKALEQYQARSIDDLLSGLSPSLTFHDGDMGSHIQLNGLNNDYILYIINNPCEQFNTCIIGIETTLVPIKVTFHIIYQ